MGIPSPCDDVGAQANFLETSAILSSYQFLFVAPAAGADKAFGESIQCEAGTEDFTGDFRAGDVAGTLRCTDADGGGDCAFDLVTTRYDPLFDMGGAILAALGGPPPVSCGDGTRQGAEECDDGNNRNDDGCSATCLIEECGDGIVQPSLGETCDDGNTAGGDGCAGDCTAEACGNGTLDEGEQCDDGNFTDGDGCSAACVTEFCGDGVLQVGLEEACDDGNAVNGDGCSTDCERDLPFAIEGTIGAVTGCGGAVANGDSVRFDVFASGVARRNLAVGACGARFLAETFGEVPAGTATFTSSPPFSLPIIVFDFDVGIPFDCAILGGVDSFLANTQVLSFFTLAFVEGASLVPGKALAENVQCAAGTTDFTGDFDAGDLAATLACVDSDGNGTCAFEITTSQFEADFDLRQAIRDAPVEP
ncbi:MAG: DUF4215 domain-containing protein [Myxococcales bacterium]|nr:DUF4215 domain-containing protein [Myxococcales bacterium]